MTTPPKTLTPEERAEAVYDKTAMGSRRNGVPAIAAAIRAAIKENDAEWDAKWDAHCARHADRRRAAVAAAYERAAQVLEQRAQWHTESGAAAFHAVEALYCARRVRALASGAKEGE